MEINTRIISIRIGTDEWAKCKQELDKMRFEKLEFGYKTTPCLHDFLDSIDNVAKNPAMIINRKINTFKS